ncbi:DNA helicase UvrD [Candidatus Micrarchaeota archaeon]|nr:DNA helicase UvrD [Candidatus Micrarchaeota archaeon]
MQFFADLHLHSKYSRATSINSDLEHFALGGRVKGLHIIGTGDFTHPKWFREIKEKLAEEGKGLYALKKELDQSNKMLFMLTAEVSTIVSTPKGVKKVHHVLHSPSFDDVQKLNDVYSKKGNLEADGRPTIGNCSSEEFAEMTLEASPSTVIVSAHAWTPWFSVFGSNSGYNSVEECYGIYARKIPALETGMSSDPLMNWRLSKLDAYALMSNSDSHSPNPERIGRECNVFEFEPEKISFEAIFDAVRKKDKSHFLFTVETDPAYGKYHFTGHRLCGVVLSPEEARKARDICPECRRKLTVGVEERVEELADRPPGFKPENAIPFKHLISLSEIIGDVLGKPITSNAVKNEFDKLIARFGNEFNILLDVPKEELENVVSERLAEGIIRVREDKVTVVPGYDGVYGKIEIFDEGNELETRENKLGRKQKSIGDYL